MKIKNFVLFDTVFIDALMTFVKLPIPMRASFPLDKCLKKFQEEEIAVKTARDNLVKKYGEVTYYDANDQIPEGASVGDPKGWDVSLASNKNQEMFSKEVTDLMNLEFDIHIDNKIKLSVSEIEDVKVSTSHINKIRLLIDFVD